MDVFVDHPDLPRWIPFWKEPRCEEWKQLEKTRHPPAESPSKLPGADLSREEAPGAEAGAKDSKGKRGRGFWPLGVHSNEPVEWSAEDVAKLKERLPSYDVRGPGKYAICHGESGLFGAHSRLLATRRRVYSVEDAARMCDEWPGCTHFSVTVGPDYPMGWEPLHWLPFRADLCGGQKISIANIEGVNAFVGIKRTKQLLPPAEAPEAGEGMPDGPIELSQMPSLLAPVGVPIVLAVPQQQQPEVCIGLACATERLECSARRGGRRQVFPPSCSGREFL